MFAIQQILGTLALARLVHSFPTLEERTPSPVCEQIAGAISSASDVYYLGILYLYAVFNEANYLYCKVILYSKKACTTGPAQVRKFHCASSSLEMLPTSESL